MSVQPPDLPASAWAFAWTCLAAQLVSVADNGRSDSNLLVPSMILGALVVGWVSYGVLRARTVRVVLVWILFVLGLIFVTIGVLEDSSGWGLVYLAAFAVQFWFFVKFTRSDYYQWQRSRPREPGPSLSGLVAIAFLVGALGGFVGAQDDGIRAEVTV